LNLHPLKLCKQALSQIDSIGPHAALQLIAEIGTDMSRWKTAQHFTSWLALAPHNKISGGRLLSSRTAPSANRAAVVLRRCAMSLSTTESAEFMAARIE
jgi:transposase